MVEREKEIRKFEPEEYWKIRAEFAKFTAELKKLDGKPAKVVNETEAKSIEDSLKQGNFSVSVIDERMAKRNPGAPFTTSTIQQEASVKLGFSVKRTMIVAQQLYEGNFNIPDGIVTGAESARFFANAIDTETRGYWLRIWFKIWFEETSVF